MEIKLKISFKDMIYKEENPHTDKREINWKRIAKFGFFLTSLFILIMVLIPVKAPTQAIFHESTQAGSVISTSENNPTDETTAQFQNGNANLQGVPSSLDHSISPVSNGGSRGHGLGGKERNATMILARSGTDSKSQLSAGTRIFIRLTDKIIVTNQAMPMVGIITKDVTSENELAIPQGSKILGSVSFDDSIERASINLTNVIFPDGRERQISAIAIGADEQIGVEGNIKSNAILNTAGLALTRFIGSYAQGSMSTGQFGAQTGGRNNGIKSAISATAEDRANVYAEDMKKQKKWIELSYGTQFIAILNQSFIFKEPGGINGGR
jgi:type IV secretory pathway VirB10-like protein